MNPKFQNLVKIAGFLQFFGPKMKIVKDKNTKHYAKFPLNGEG